MESRNAKTVRTHNGDRVLFGPMRRTLPNGMRRMADPKVEQAEREIAKCWFCYGTGEEYVGTGIVAGEPTEYYRPCTHCAEIQSVEAK
jgi:hypothetical protein